MALLTRLVFAVLLLLCILSVSIQANPFYVIRDVTQGQWMSPGSDGISKRALDKCGCNMGCFYSSARQCISCCALAL